MMGMTAPKGSGSSSSGYTTRVVTREYTLHDAVAKAASGEIDVMEVFHQMPDDLRDLFDQTAQAVHSRTFSELTMPQRREIMQAFADALCDAKTAPPVELPKPPPPPPAPIMSLSATFTFSPSMGPAEPFAGSANPTSTFVKPR